VEEVGGAHRPVGEKLISLMLDNLHRSLRDAGELEPAASASVTE
jgi:hypothetical protein